MKILSLDFIAFGPFTDLSVDLSQGNEGVHIIYGPNEAGKSSALRALTSLFYGIHAQSADNFIHTHKNMKIGATLLHSDSSELTVYRRKGTKKTLLDNNNEPLDESALMPFTGAMSKEFFTTMFGIDHQSLIDGGKEILKGGGAVGESLFAASMGGMQIHTIVHDLDNEASELFKFRGANQKIPLAIDRYKETLNTCKEHTLTNQEWADHDMALRQAKEEKEGIDKDLGELEKEKNRLERFNRALPKIAQYHEHNSALSQMGEVKILGHDFSDLRRDSLHKLMSAQEEQKRAEQALTVINQKISTLTVPEKILKQKVSISELHKQLGSNKKAFKDLLRLEIEKRQLESDAEAIIKDLRPDMSLKDADTFRVGKEKRAAIQELGNAYQALEDNCTRWIEDVQNLAEKLAVKKDHLQSLTTVKEPDTLKKALSRVQKQGDLEQELKTRMSELEREKKSAAITLKKLKLWSGTLEELEALSVPQPETIDRFITLFDDTKQKHQRLEDRTKEIEDRRAEIEQSLEQINLSGAVPTEKNLTKAREHRDKGWNLIRRTWLESEDVTEEAQAFASDTPLDLAYEKSVVHADDIADRLRREADGVAKQADLLAQTKKANNDLSTLQVELAAIDEQQKELKGSWEALWQPLGISPLTPQEMRSWLMKFTALPQQAEQIRLIQDRIDLTQARIKEHQSTLSQCLVQLGEPSTHDNESLALLIDRSEQVIETLEKIIQQKKETEKEIRQIESDLTHAIKQKEHSTAKLTQWQTQWAASVQELGLSEQARPSLVNTVLSQVQSLFHNIDKIKSLESRMIGIKRDGEQFEKNTQDLVQATAPDLDNETPEQAVSELNDRLSKALGDSRELNALKVQKSEKQDIIHQTSTTIEISRSRLDKLCHEAGCHEYEELEEMERRSNRAKEIQKELESLKKQIHEDSGGASFDSFINESQDMDKDALPSQIRILSERIEELNSRKMELQKEIGREENQLESMKGGSDAAEAAEKAEEYFSTIHSHVNQYVRLRLASLILNREIERYRKENQAPLLKRAGEVFAHLTRGSFESLQTDYNDKDEPVIIGLRPSGQVVTVEGMSDGTRDQLFFALRIASLEKYLLTNEPVPLIVDDILINFDNHRAEATLSVLAELSQKTQIIFFTHHSHLLDLAQKTLSEDILTVHSLNGVVPF